MTGMATLKGGQEDWSWVWDIRAVNARGLDIKLRLPDWVEGLDQQVRPILTKSVARGSVTLGLRITRETKDLGEVLDENALAQVLKHLSAIEQAASKEMVTLNAPSSADILGLRGVLTSNFEEEEDTKPIAKALVAELPTVLAAFNDMRATEGKNLSDVLHSQLDHIEALTKEAAQLAEKRKDATAARLRENIVKVLDNTDIVDEARLAQELAVIAVKTDVTEEIDRLHAHVAAARDLLGGSGPIGRKLDFLSQEFNREANTLCSKAQSSELTSVGLDLKATIDQMREQVQNVE